MSLIRNIFANIKNVANDIINPATEEKQDDIITEIQTLKDNQTNWLQKIQITDENWNIWNMEDNLAMPINIQDQYTEVVDLHLSSLKSMFTIETNISLYDTIIHIDSPILPVIWDLVCLKENKSFYQWQIIDVSSLWWTEYNITLNTPLDFAFTTNWWCSLRNQNLAVNWSVTPVIFSISPIWLTDISWDICSITLSITDNTQMDWSKFWWITPLDKWIFLRRVNWIVKNLFNVRDNHDIASHFYDITYDDRAWWSWLYSLRAKKTFNWQGYNWVTLRLENNDELQLVVQDDLTWLTDMQVVCQGHVVQ